MTSHGIGIKRAYDDRNRSVGSVDCSCCHQDGAECNKRLRSEATIHNKDGQTCLHLLCQDRCCPVDDVIALIDSNPGALKRKDMYGRSVRLLEKVEVDSRVVLFWLIRLSYAYCSHFSMP
jgi:hypothetical protein